MLSNASSFCAPQVAEVVETVGLEANEDVMESCKWLFDKDLPITEESIKSLLDLQDIKEQFDISKAADEIVIQYETGVNPENADLRFFKSDNSNVDLDSFLREVEKQLSDHNLEIEDITFHRQLEEVRLKMTTEVSAQLEEMGIQIDMEHISDIIDGLKEIEDSYFRSLFAEAGIDASDAQVEQMKQTTDKVNALASMPETASQARAHKGIR